MNQLITQFLKNLWLSDLEIKVYIFLVSQWENIASMISKRLNIKRASIYTVLKWLEEKWMIIFHIKNKINFYKATNPDDVIELCKFKEMKAKSLTMQAQEFKKHLDLFKDTDKSQNNLNDGKLKYYEWINDVIELAFETLDEKDKEILCFWIMNKFIKDKKLWKDYTEKRIKEWFRVKSIQPETTETQDYKKRDSKELRETLIIPKEFTNDWCEINIIWDMVVFFTSEWNNPVWFKIKNKSIAQALRSLFWYAWKK